MQEATVYMPLEEFVNLNTQPGIRREVLLQGLTKRERKGEEELTDLQEEVKKVERKLRFTKFGLLMLLLALLGYWAGRMSAMF